MIVFNRDVLSVAIVHRSDVYGDAVMYTSIGTMQLLESYPFRTVAEEQTGNFPEFLYKFDKSHQSTKACKALTKTFCNTSMI